MLNCKFSVILFALLATLGPSGASTVPSMSPSAIDALAPLDEKSADSICRGVERGAELWTDCKFADKANTMFPGSFGSVKLAIKASISPWNATHEVAIGLTSSRAGKMIVVNIVTKARYELTLSENDVRGLLRTLEEIKFWQLPRHINDGCLDTELWVVEGAITGRPHQLVIGSDCPPNSAMTVLAKKMRAIARSRPLPTELRNW